MCEVRGVFGVCVVCVVGVVCVVCGMSVVCVGVWCVWRVSCVWYV